MKRIGNLFASICDINNLELADIKARRSKRNRRDILKHDKDRDINILKLHESLINKTYRTSEYSTFKIFEGKERLIYKLPYYPDRKLILTICDFLAFSIYLLIWKQKNVQNVT